MLRYADVAGALAGLLWQRYGIGVEDVIATAPIPGSYWGAPEAGLIGTRVFASGETPVHSVLHEACHLICMDGQRRAVLHTDAGGTHAEEDAVCYLQIVLAGYVSGVGRERMLCDMDAWGYTFRLGSAGAWFENDADDARHWLLEHGLLRADGTPTWMLRP